MFLCVAWLKVSLLKEGISVALEKHDSFPAIPDALIRQFVVEATSESFYGTSRFQFNGKEKLIHLDMVGNPDRESEQQFPARKCMTINWKRIAFPLESFRNVFTTGSAT
jgi:hypothetical protein